MAINNNYTAVVSVRLNESQLQTQLKNIASQNVSVKLKLDEGVAKNLNSINKSINSVSTSAKSLGTTVDSSMSKASTSIQTASKHTKTLGQDFLDTTAKVAKFGAITALLGVFTGAVANAISTVKTFDDAITDFKKVSDLSGASLDDYTDKLGKLGETVARTRKQFLARAYSDICLRIGLIAGNPLELYKLQRNK